MAVRNASRGRRSKSSPIRPIENFSAKPSQSYVLARRQIIIFISIHFFSKGFTIFSFISCHTNVENHDRFLRKSDDVLEPTNVGPHFQDDKNPFNRCAVPILSHMCNGIQTIFFSPLNSVIITITKSYSWSQQSLVHSAIHFKPLCSNLNVVIHTSVLRNPFHFRREFFCLVRKRKTNLACAGQRTLARSRKWIF